MNLSELYSDPKFPGSFSGAEHFYKEVKAVNPEVTKQQVSEFLKSKPSYYLHKTTQKPRKYRRTLVYGPRDLLQIDLLDLQKYSLENRGYRYICVIIDCFTKFIWLKPLKNKTGKSLVKALALLLMTERPKLIQCDQGTEFFNKNVAKMLQAFGPKLYHTFSDKKAAIVERVQRTLRMRMGRMFTDNKNYNWIDHYEDMTDAYNNSFHRSIKMKPADVTNQHTGLIYARLFSRRKFPRSSKQFAVGDRVRIAMKPDFMQKEYLPKWSEEVFLIKSRKASKPITYHLTDLTSEDVSGSFYREELQHAV